MANTVLNTTYLTYPAKGLREDLENVIYDISPEETPFMSTVGRSKCNAVLHEWQTDGLEPVNTANAQLEGLNFTEFPVMLPTSRVGNVAQISGKLVSVSGTLEAVDKAGRAKESAYQLVKKAKELKRDMESIALENVGAVMGAAATARKTATMGAWLRMNTNHAGADPAAPAPTVPLAPRTDGAVRALSEILFKDVISQIWGTGGSLKIAMFGPINKQNASKFPGIATKTFDQSKLEPIPTIGASDVYVSDFGVIRIIANRLQRERDGWLIDPEYVSFGYLRPFQSKQLAETGDAVNYSMLAEWALVMKNEGAHGLVADLNSVVQ